MGSRSRLHATLLTILTLAILVSVTVTGWALMRWAIWSVDVVLGAPAEGETASMSRGLR